MLSHYSFERKTIKLGQKLFFHLFDLVMVNAQILHYKSNKKNMSLEIFYEKVAEVLLASDGTEIQVQGQTSSAAGRLVGRDHSVYSIPVTHAKLEGKSQLSFLASAGKQAQTEKTVKKCTRMYCRKCNVGLCVGQCSELNHTKMNYWE
jgi:hypothetical protein